MDLNTIYDAVRADPFWDPFRGPGIRLVPGYGASRPRVLLVGEAPGATENTHGRPFCGASGQVLEQLAALAGLHWRDIPPDDDGQGPTQNVGEVPNCFITNVVKYRPPGNRTPTPEEIERGVPTLRQEWIALGRPRVIVAVGNTARAALLPNVPRDTGRARPIDLPGDTVLWWMLHPAYALRQRQARPLVERDWEEFGAWLAEMED